MRVRVTGLKEYKDRHGKLRRYYRRKGAPAVAISADLKGAALVAEIARLDALYKPLAPIAGTLRILIDEYKARSAHWKALRERTQADYDRVFAALAPALDTDLKRFTTPVIAHMRDKARDEKGFKFANQLVVCLRMIFAFGVEYGHMRENTADAVGPVARPSDLPEANRPWTPAEAVNALTAPIYLAGPIAVAAYLGIREGDIIAMSKAALAERLLSLTTSKTRRTLELPVCDDLWAILKAYLAWRSELWEGKRRKAEARGSREDLQDLAMTLFVNSRGKPWTADGFRTSWGKWRDDLVKAKKVQPGMTFHGARHTVATILAESGFEGEKVKHLLGHGSETITEHYSRRAKRRAMLKEMADAVQSAYRAAGENVVSLDQKRNGSV
jgi:integrase